MSQSTPDRVQPDPSVPAAPDTTSSAPADVEQDDRSRREFLCRSAQKLAYVAPLVMLFHPRAACASNGSTLTYWDQGAGEIKHRT